MSYEIVCFQGGEILGDEGWKVEDLWVCQGKVVQARPRADRVVEVSGLRIAPGWIDLQCNGAFGVDFSHHPEEVENVAKQLPCFGITAFLPTLISSPPSVYQNLHRFSPRKVHQGAEILGVHLEGPFLNPLCKGCHPKEHLQATVSPEKLMAHYGALDFVKMVTLASELPGALETVMFLKERGVLCAAGHSAATEQEALAALESGVQLVTHLGNAMAPLHQRESGWWGVALGEPQLAYTCIVDGVHLSPRVVQLMWRAHREGMMLITDSIAALGQKVEQASLGEARLEVSSHGAYLQGSKTLAGSITPMNQMVRNLIAFTGCPLEEALRAASQRPAKQLGLFPKKGSLREGADADFVLLNALDEVVSTYVQGNLSFCK